jgi:hypothetical protein
VVLADRIVDLQTAMTRLAQWHQTTVRHQMQAVNTSFCAALQEFTVLTDTLGDHEDDLRTLLIEMGVETDTTDENAATTTTLATVALAGQKDGGHSVDSRLANAAAAAEGDSGGRMLLHDTMMTTVSADKSSDLLIK